MDCNAEDECILRGLDLCVTYDEIGPMDPSKEMDRRLDQVFCLGVGEESIKRPMRRGV